jgi:hypothetical protein
MREREPHCAKLQQAGRSRIENTPGNVDVSDCIAVEQKTVVAQVVEKGSD